MKSMALTAHILNSLMTVCGVTNERAAIPFSGAREYYPPPETKLIQTRLKALKSGRLKNRRARWAPVIVAGRQSE